MTEIIEEKTLRETAVKTKPAKLKKDFNPIRLFADNAFAARIWFFVALGAIVFCIIQPYLIISAYRQKERVAILDEAGTFHITPLLSFEEATKLHSSQAMLATYALFQRNPAGWDEPELLDKMFLDNLKEQINQDFRGEAKEFESKQIHQKVEVLKIDILETRNDQVLVQVEGQLIRNGIFEGQAFVESPKFKIRYTMARNTRLTENGRFPLAVFQYQFKYLSQNETK